MSLNEIMAVTYTTAALLRVRMATSIAETAIVNLKTCKLPPCAEMEETSPGFKKTETIIITKKRHREAISFLPHEGPSYMAVICPSLSSRKSVHPQAIKNRIVNCHKVGRCRHSNINDAWRITSEMSSVCVLHPKPSTHPSPETSQPQLKNISSNTTLSPSFYLNFFIRGKCTAHVM